MSIASMYVYAFLIIVTLAVIWKVLPTDSDNSKQIAYIKFTRSLVTQKQTSKQPIFEPPDQPLNPPQAATKKPPLIKC